MSYRGRDGLDYDSELSYLQGLEENWEIRASEKWQAETGRLKLAG